jgi:UDP-N-acetylglucosamine acyltransferase
VSGETTIKPGVHPEARVDPDAFVDASASVGAGVRIERACIVGPRVAIGAGCVLRARSVVQQDTVIGVNNEIGHFAVLGGDPQDRAFDPATPGRLEIGDGNVFREHVTIHRSTEPGPPTRIGDKNYFMVYAHAGHNARVGDRNTFANGTALAGHAHVGSDNVFSAFTAVHQFTTVGDSCMIRHAAGISMHLPPFLTVSDTNAIAGVNRVGLARHPSIGDGDARAVREAFRAIYRSRGGRPMERTARELLDVEPSAAAKRFLAFIVDNLNDEDERRRKRGIAGHIARARARIHA